MTGRVLCDGKPAEGGTIIFTPLDAPDQTGRAPGNPGPESSGLVGADGTFTLMRTGAAEGELIEGALVGPHTVRFGPPRTQPYRITAEDKANNTPEELEKLQAQIDAMPVFKPLACGNEMTPNAVEVKPGPNSFEFTLQPSAAAPEPVAPRRSGPQ